jgi:hypothetical protein
MNLYIETENGVTKNHPAFEDNLLLAFGSIPVHWEPFARVEKPTLGVYELMTAEDATYEKVDGVWTDVWHKRNMTAEEITAKQQATISAFNSHPQASNWSTWTLDEATCIMVPPIPRPEPDQVKLDAGIHTFWSGADNNWKDSPVRPEGKPTFDFLTWQWVPIVNEA